MRHFIVVATLALLADRSEAQEAAAWKDLFRR